MDFDFSKKVVELQERLSAFMTQEIYPNERTFEEQLELSADRWTLPPIMEALKVKAHASMESFPAKSTSCPRANQP